MCFNGDTENDGLITWRRLVAESPSMNISVDNSSFVLAADRTYRKDPLDDFKKYTGGWNISNRHYWAVRSSNPLC